MEIRNIAIIAHVDHGKTTLTDRIMQQTGMFAADMSMDTNDLEKERGITIYSKNTTAFYKGTKINIVDTPGHADFGSEVERVLRSIDSVLLVVDAQEGPMPQTRFVLMKSLELGLKPIVILNKIDKPAADPAWAEEQVIELFMELGATDEQLDFSVVYAVARDGIAKNKLSDDSDNLTPLLDTVLEKVPVASGDTSADFRAQVFNLGYDDYLGRLAVARIYGGILTVGESLIIKKSDGVARKGKVTKIFGFRGVAREELTEAEAGDIVLIAGLPDIYIGETLCLNEATVPMPAIAIDEPTITLNFLVNDSPFAGREGEYVTGRQIGDRLRKELEINVGLKVDLESEMPFSVSGRGELHIAILLENMRREGYELQVSQPQIIIKEEKGQRLEPFEELIIDVPSEFQGVVMERLGVRKALLHNVLQRENTVRLVFEIPTRGLLGYRSQFIVDTKGKGILASRVVDFKPYVGEIQKRKTGSMTSMMTGTALAFALSNLQERGELYIGANTEVYEGMVIGNTAKGDEMAVNPTKGKQLTNMRAAGTDESVSLVTPKLLTIESGLEIMADGEYLEITPTSVRLRKKRLKASERKVHAKK